MTEETKQEIKRWLEDFERIDKGKKGVEFEGTYADPDTFEGGAYLLFKKILEEEKEVKEK